MESRTPPDSSRWARIADASGWGLPPERLAGIAPILDDLDRKTRGALDHDLSFVEPMFSFRPSVSEPAAEEE